MHKQSLALHFLELLLAGLACASTEDQLTPKLPLQGNAPFLSSLLVDDGVVVLQVGTKALGFQGDPESVLVHGVRVFRPVAKVVGIESYDGCEHELDG